MSRKQFIFIAVAFMAWGIVCGAALYEHVAVIPVWTRNPPETIAFLQPPNGLQAALWWQSIHPIVLTALVAAVVASWRNKAVRSPLLAILGGYVFVLAATGVWYVPELLALTTDPNAEIDPAEWKMRADRWEVLSLGRIAFMLVLTTFLARAFLRSVPSPARAPTNDA
jgi:Na+/H+-dicarboxylate symporter